MPVFQVRQEGTNAIVWTGSADGREQALDAMARAAGFKAHAEIPRNVQDVGLSVEMLNFDSNGSTGRSTGGRSATKLAERLRRTG